MSSLLSNMRLLCLPSESQGQDWFEKGRELDAWISKLGLDLAEEAVYFLFSDTPSGILKGQGGCLIARSVIGPKLEVEPPLKLIDRTASWVYRERIFGKTWDEVMERAHEEHIKAMKGPRTLEKSFFLCIRRRLGPELSLETEVLFIE